jgi:hypothetical protein
VLWAKANQETQKANEQGLAAWPFGRVKYRPALAHDRIPIIGPPKGHPNCLDRLRRAVHASSLEYRDLIIGVAVEPIAHDGVNGQGPTAFVRKAIVEQKLGKTSVFTLPVQSYDNLLLEAGAELCSPLGPRALAGVHHGGASPICCFVLRGIR